MNHSTLHSHSDRDEVKRRAEADPRRLLAALGVELGRGRKMFRCPFHAEKTGSAHWHKGRLKCFGCGLSLDPFALVMRVHGCDFKTALQWLADLYGIPFDNHEPSPAERERWRRADRAAAAEAEALTTWRRRLIDAARAERNAIWTAEQDGCRWARAHLADEHADDSRWSLVWSAVMRQDRGDEWNRAVNILEAAAPAELLPIWRRARERRDAAA